MQYSIDRFWVPQFQGASPASTNKNIRGWYCNLEKNPYFVEPGLSLRESSGETSSSICFVAAPGAVGKSTFAREICARTGSIYLDLAQADSVAGNYVTGGLFRAGLTNQSAPQPVGLVIDALDEARLRVTQRSFYDFMHDLVTVSREQNFRIVCFGRVSIIEEAWLLACDQEIEGPIFDISFFDNEKARSFVMATLNRLSAQAGYEQLGPNLQAHFSVYKEVCAELVADIEKASASDDDGFFSGYAPVLEAVATVLGQTSNPSTLKTTAMQEIKKGEVLQRLTSHILEREASKLRDQIETIPEDIKGTLYTPEEQLDRLCHIIPGAPPYAPDSVIEKIPQDHRDSYVRAVSSFIEQHPFLDGTAREASSAVFSAAIIAHALFARDSERASAVERFLIDGKYKSNPFLIDFYLDKLRETENSTLVPPERIAALYDSIRARARAGDIAWMSIEGSEDSDDADVEIQILSGQAALNNRPKVINITTSQIGCLKFAREIVDVSVSAPQIDISIGSGNPVEFVAPVYLSAARLQFDCQEIVCLKNDKARNEADNSVVLESEEILSSNVSSAPVVRPGAELSVSWPGSNQYPWSTFSVEFAEIHEDLGKKLQLFRRLIMAFRSHSKGRLARFKDKVEHFRMTKGPLGNAIRVHLMKDRIITLEGNMYFLDPDELGRRTGSSFQNIKMKNFNEQLKAYVGKMNVPN